MSTSSASSDIPLALIALLVLIALAFCASVIFCFIHAVARDRRQREHLLARREARELGIRTAIPLDQLDDAHKRTLIFHQLVRDASTPISSPTVVEGTDVNAASSASMLPFALNMDPNDPLYRYYENQYHSQPGTAGGDDERADARRVGALGARPSFASLTGSADGEPTVVWVDETSFSSDLAVTTFNEDDESSVPPLHQLEHLLPRPLLRWVARAGGAARRSVGIVSDASEVSVAASTASAIDHPSSSSRAALPPASLGAEPGVSTVTPAEVARPSPVRTPTVASTQRVTPSAVLDDLLELHPREHALRGPQQRLWRLYLSSHAADGEVLESPPPSPVVYGEHGYPYTVADDPLPASTSGSHPNN